MDKWNLVHRAPNTVVGKQENNNNSNSKIKMIFLKNSWCFHFDRNISSIVCLFVEMVNFWFYLPEESKYLFSSYEIVATQTPDNCGFLHIFLKVQSSI